MKALIFDMDGVIVDSEHQWHLSSQDFYRSLMPDWREEDNHKVVGMAIDDLYVWLLKEYRLKASKEVFLKGCHEIAEKIYREKVTITPGFMELLQDVRRRRIPVGLASSSPKAWVTLVLERFALAEHIDAWTCADDVALGKTKPEPDLYELVVRRLGLSAEGCLAIEDSIYGVKAAKRAGLICAALRNGSNAAQDLSAADFELSSLAGVTVDSLIAKLDD